MYMHATILQPFTIVSLVFGMALVKYLPRSLLHQYLPEFHYNYTSIYNIISSKTGKTCIEDVAHCIGNYNYIIQHLYLTDH